MQKEEIIKSSEDQKFIYLHMHEHWLLCKLYCNNVNKIHNDLTPVKEAINQKVESNTARQI